MKAHTDKKQESKSKAIVNTISKKKSTPPFTFQFKDKRPEAIQMRKIQEIANQNTNKQERPIQKKENNTGLPDNLKSRIENLSGYSMDDVTVHYNSDKPAQLQAHAYAQGTNIHIGPGQEKHLPHEAWHVVQQKQGRVRPTMQMKGKVNINDDAGLEKEANVMGAECLRSDFSESLNISNNQINTLQRKSIISNVMQMALPITKDEWKTINTTDIQTISDDNNQQNIYAKFHYIENIVRPFLINRYDYISAYYDEEKINYFKRKLMISYSLEKYLRESNSPDRFTNSDQWYQGNQLDQFIIEANKLPTTMEEIHHIAGGYEANSADFGGKMHDLGKTLNHIARDIFDGGDGTRALDSVPAAIPNKNTKNVPVISINTFYKHKKIPKPLKRLVMDIYLHWKSRKVMDTRSDQQKREKAKTPDQAGALRTYHMNEHATIPALANPYGGDHPLHDHYLNNSQGSSVHGGAPYGFAEYTGIDSDQNKIVLDYVNGQIYITCTHYKHWFDSEDSPVPLSGDIASSRSSLGGNNTEDNLQSPWVKVLMN